MLVSLTVGKVDAGMAVLLTEDKRIIEFPSILLPPDISSGSIVDITVSRNLASEAQTQKSFAALQSDILSTFGSQTPTTPVLRCRNATQTSIVLEWDPIDTASASIRSLSLLRNGSKVGTIPRPESLTTTKISGLAMETEYKFQLVLRTSAGTHASDVLTVKTHALTDLTGITVTPGLMPAPIRSDLVSTVERVGGRVADTVRIDTTHFICTEPRGPQWEKAREMNIPIVVPDWIKGCESEGRIVGVKHYYLDADPKLRQMGPSVVQQQSQIPERPRTPTRTPETKITPPTPEQRGPEVPPKDTPKQQEKTIPEQEEPEPRTDDETEASSHNGGHDEQEEDEGDDDGELKVHKKATVEDAPEEDASFTEVAL